MQATPRPLICTWAMARPKMLHRCTALSIQLTGMRTTPQRQRKAPCEWAAACPQLCCDCSMCGGTFIQNVQWGCHAPALCSNIRACVVATSSHTTTWCLWQAVTTVVNPTVALTVLLKYSHTFTQCSVHACCHGDQGHGWSCKSSSHQKGDGLCNSAGR